MHFILVVHIMWRIGLHFEYVSAYKTLWSSLIVAYAVSFGVSVHVQPINSALRNDFMLWVCYCYVMSTLFQTYYTTYLVNPGFYSVINTVDDICRKGFEYGYQFGLEQIIFDGNSSWLCGGRGRVDCVGHANEGCFSRVVKGDNFAYLGVEFYAEYFEALNLPHDSNALCSLDESFETIQIVMYLKKGSHFLKPFNLVLRRIIETGLLKKADDIMRIKWRLQNGYVKTIELNREPTDYVVLSAKHFHISFGALLIGLTSSFIVFLLEVIINLCFD